MAAVESSDAVSICRSLLKDAISDEPYGVSFHVGSQQTDPEQWDAAIAETAGLFRRWRKPGLNFGW